MSDLFKSALSYIGSSSSQSGSTTAPASGSAEIIKLSGECVKLHRVIAEGGSSYIYAGQFAKNNLIIAVKKIPCQHDNEDRILSEIKFMNEFSHINIAKYHGYNKIGGVYWIGMEFCSTLRLPLAQELVGAVFGQIVCGVNYLHQLGITHWDLKVENCMVGRDGMIKLIDFGSASKKSYNTSQLTTVQRSQLEDELFQITTPMYRPPEILDMWSEMQIDFRVDIWALGCILYYLVHSEHPFADSNKLAIINCKYSRKLSSYQNIIESLLVVQPQDRWPLEQVLKELRSQRVDYSVPVKLEFDEFQISPGIIPINQSTSLLHSIRGGAESLFKNLKESGSRIYSSQQQQQQQQQQPVQHPSIPVQAKDPPPRRPPLPRPAVPPPPVEASNTRQLTGEDVIKANIDNSTEAFNLIPGGFDQAPTMAADEPKQRAPSKNLMEAESIDLLGDFKDVTSDFVSSGSPAVGSDVMGDLLGLSQPARATVIPNLVPKAKDPFDSLLSDQIPAEKPLLPTSSSYNHLSSLKVDNKNEMVKSTPNLNDLFGDLLMGPTSTSSSASANRGQPVVDGQFNSQFNNRTVPPPMPAFSSSPNYSGIQSSNKPQSLSSSAMGNNVNTAGFSQFSTASHSTEFASVSSGVGPFCSSTTDPKRSPQVSGKKVDLNAAFGELLNEQGFTGSTSAPATAKTINEMRKRELALTKTPEELKVAEWVEGKRKNIRALLSSLHTVVWEGCSWKQAGMAQMVEPNDVKKMYRKACLAIHPDKLRGEPQEELAKIIFIELNEAWAHFESEMK